MMMWYGDENLVKTFSTTKSYIFCSSYFEHGLYRV